MPRNQVAHSVHRCKFQGQCQASWKGTQHRSQTRIAVLNRCRNHTSVQDRWNYTSNYELHSKYKSTQQCKIVQQSAVSASGKWDDLRFLAVFEHINPASHRHHAVLGKWALPKHNVHSETRSDVQDFPHLASAFDQLLLHAAIYNSYGQPSIPWSIASKIPDAMAPCPSPCMQCTKRPGKSCSNRPAQTEKSLIVTCYHQNTLHKLAQSSRTKAIQAIRIQAFA